jgi:hypothetical protein
MSVLLLVSAFAGGCGKGGGNQPVMKPGPERVGPVAPTPVEGGEAPAPSPLEPAGATSSGGKEAAVAAQEALKIVPLHETEWQVPEGTSLDDAYQQFSEKYTPAKVSRIVVKVTDGDAPPHLADWLKSILPALSAPPGERMAVYATVQGDTATAIVAPAKNFYPLRGKYDFMQNIQTAEYKTADLPPPPGSPAEIKELAAAMAIVKKAEYPDFNNALTKLERWHTQAVADAIFAHILERLEGSMGAIALETSLQKMNPYAENCVLQWFARNPADKGFATRASLIENHLGKVGTARSLPVLQAHLQAKDEQLVNVTKQTIEAVEKRLAE